MSTATGSLRDYFVLEARHAPRRAPVGVALAGVLGVVLGHLLIPRMPEGAIAFMELGMRIEGMAAVLLANDLVAIYFAAFFVGAAGLLETVGAAREENRLEILLAKPLRASTLLAARTAPVLASSAAVGGVVSVATSIAVLPHLDASATVTIAGSLGAGVFLTALALVELALLEIVLVRMRDGFQALLVASALWFVAMIPAATLIYRPDALDAHPGLADAIAIPSMLWHDATSAWLGPLALVLAVPIAAVLVVIAAWRLETGDAR